MKKLTRIFLRLFFLFAALAAILLLSINLYMCSYSKKYIFSSPEQLPQSYTVIVPGAKVYSNNVSHVVRDRLDAAANLIKNGTCQRILLSGDHGQKNYDEVNQMRKYLQNIYAVDGSLIFMDHAGFSTYESMYRARDIFCVDQAVIVTQKFHTVRSVYIARKLGLQAYAYEAPELTPFSKETHTSWTIRESLARVKSFFLVMFKAEPTYLGEKIPITGDAKNSWDQQ